MRKYGKSMFEILSEINEATFTYDFFDANKPMSQIQADGRKYRVKLKVNKGKGSMGADEVVITGNEQDIVKYAQAHLDAGKRVRNLRDLKKDLNASYHDENIKVDEKFSSIEPKVIDRIEKMMNGSRQEKDQIQNMLNYLMPREVVDMVRYKLKIKEPMGKIKIR